MSDPLVRLRNVDRAYDQGGGKVFVLRRINLDIAQGEFVSIMGPSGAGKSTLLHVLGMHDGAFTGEYEFVGYKVHALGRKERQELQKKHIGFVHIVGKKDLYPSQLSGGQQQLVGVARAVVASPKVILADEPTGNLHTDQGREIMELFRRLNEAGTTIVQVTHSDVNAGYGNRIVKLRDGWVVE